MNTLSQSGTGVVQPAGPKTKTKAKKRYLKAKKERRKNRKVLSPTEGGAPEPGEDEKFGEHDSEEGGELDETETSVPVVAEPTQATSGSGKEKRPKKKRQKIDTPPPEGAEESLGTPEPPPPKTNPASKQRSQPEPSIQGALPSFAAPRRPDAPSKETLALQGLDKAIVEAELVDPSKTLPIPDTDDDQGTGISQRMRRRLHSLGIDELFAVQTAVIPMLLSNPEQRLLYLPYNPPRDLCVSAPTGSGKTLAYVVPIVEILSTRVVTRLRALVVLPTRDLVSQVRETFEAVGKGRGLKIGTATGQHSFAHEQTQLVLDRTNDLQGGSSKVDILICTPGRLMDHLNSTPNFTLQHLRYLVIDEADRLLAQSFQDWLARVLAATRPPELLDSQGGSTPTSNVNTPVSDCLAPAYQHLLRGVPHIRTDLDEKKETSCQKLLFSATLTSDPSKISALHLNDPKYMVVQNTADKDAKEKGVLDLVTEKFTMPSTLSEHFIVCDSIQKPLLLFHLVYKRGVTNALVFTKSAESTNRLVRLFEFFEAARTAQIGDSHRPKVIQAYSSELGPGDRKSILERFKSQETHILICSDLISRGIDISHVSHVVSYDAPVDMRKYVHRVGRTARAGRAGTAWTLVEEQEARYFKMMLKSADHLDVVKRLRISEKELAPFVPIYEGALDQLKEVYAR